MAIEYAREAAPSPVEVAGLFRRSGIRRPVDDLDRIGRMIANANLIVCARSAGRLIGIARALTDFSYCCYLSDLAVDREFQRRGIGRELIRRVREAAGPECTLLLLAAPEAREYYPRVGFEPIPNGWTRHREH